MAMAMARFMRMGSARMGLALLLVFFLTATYAPLFASEVAIIWWDDQGLRFPLLADLLNRNSYEKPHHLLFNVLGLLLPAYVIGWWVLGRWRKTPVTTRIMLLVAVQVLAMFLAWLPLAPSGGEFSERRALWDERRTTSHTWRNHRALVAEDPEVQIFALYPLVRHNYTSNFYSYQSPGTINPDTDRRFWWGTDDRGQDVFARMIFGSRISLTIGVVAVGISMFIGIILGATSGYFGGWVDLFIQRLVEIMMAFPTFILVLVVVAMWGRDIYLMMIVFGLTGWAGTTRLVRGEFLAQSGREYVLAAEALGLRTSRIMFRHVLPNTLTPLMISAAFGMAGMVLAESGLAFIGMGDDSVPSWGSLLDVGRQQVAYAWLIWIPGLAIFGLVSSLNLLGNAMREALDPRNEE